MRANPSDSSAYNQVMEQTGFYHNGEPVSGLFEATSLRASKRIDKIIKYGSALNDNKLNAEAIFELSGSPCIYFTRLDQAEPPLNELARLHKLAWNQGLAPMLWVVTPARVILFNCYSKPRPEDENDPSRHLIDIFEKTQEGLRHLNEFAGRRQIQLGNFWKSDKAKQIDRRERVDAALLEDLTHTEAQLVEAGLEPSIAHSLLGRSIFVAYLQDRNILKPQFFRSNFMAANFVEVLNHKAGTYALFEWIHKTFNGDLFPLTRINGRITDERDLVKPGHLRIVRDLLSGTEMATGQRRLWPYNFDIIPVELISSIYEMFAHAGDSQAARARSTHYTPINLVDLVLSDLVESLPHDARVLDLSCGSGVFLVELFRRLVARKIVEGAEWSRKLVRDTLYHQIFGVDISREAVQIAAFSLYLTALELDLNPQPPSELAFRPLIGNNLFVSDAFYERAPFNSREPFASKGFGAIVGNPPWTRSAASKSAIEYCKIREHPLAKGNPAQAFLWRIGDFANDATRISLLLPSRPFFSHTSEALKAKEALLKRYKVRMLVDLSDLRQDGLFPTSKAPAMIISAEGAKPQQNESFTYIHVERSGEFKKHGIIEIGPENIKTLSVRRVASDSDLLKVASWGKARDWALIQKLRDSLPSLDDIMKKGGWKPGIGFKTGSGRVEASELRRKKFLPSGKLRRYMIDPTELEALGRQRFERPRDPDIYKAPLVIATSGLSRRGFYASFSANDIVYPEAYYGMAIPQKNINAAYFLNAVLNSAVASYFLFLTSSTWGIERDVVKPQDLVRLPFPDPTQVDESLTKRILTFEKRLREMSTNRSSVQKDLDRAIFDLYSLDKNERRLVLDTVDLTIDLRMHREGAEALKAPQLDDLETYAKQVIAVISPFLETLKEQAMVADVLDVGTAPLNVIKFSLIPLPGRTSLIQIMKVQELEGLLEQISQRLPQQIAKKIYTHRIVRIYDGDDVYVVKPAQCRYWSQSAGLNDADEILAEHLEGNHASQ